MERPVGFTPQFTCRDCPARYLAEGAFAVVDAEDSFDYPKGAGGYRLDSVGNPTCIHPHKVGLPETAQAQEAVASPAQQAEALDATLEVPVDSEEFVEWVVRTLYDVADGDIGSVLDVIHQAARAHYSDEEIVAQLRVAFTLLASIRSEEI